MTRPLALRRPRSGRPGLPARRTWSGGHAWSPAREARPDLSDSDVRFLRGLVESVRPAVDRAAGAA